MLFPWSDSSTNYGGHGTKELHLQLVMLSSIKSGASLSTCMGVENAENVSMYSEHSPGCSHFHL